jgi:hypothetical protein
VAAKRSNLVAVWIVVTGGSDEDSRAASVGTDGVVDVVSCFFEIFERHDEGLSGAPGAFGGFGAVVAVDGVGWCGGEGFGGSWMHGELVRMGWLRSIGAILCSAFSELLSLTLRTEARVSLLSYAPLSKLSLLLPLCLRSLDVHCCQLAGLMFEDETLARSREI